MTLVSEIPYQQFVTIAEDPKWDIQAVTREEYDEVKRWSLETALRLLKSRRKPIRARRYVGREPDRKGERLFVLPKGENDYQCYFPEICAPSRWPCDVCWHRMAGAVWCHPGGSVRVVENQR